MKLPVTQILSKNKRYYQIVDADNRVIVTDVPDLGDALEIEEALNNYKKANKSIEVECLIIDNLNGSYNILLEEDGSGETMLFGNMSKAADYALENCQDGQVIPLGINLIELIKGKEL